MGSGLSSASDLKPDGEASPSYSKSSVSPFKKLILLDDAYKKYLADKTLNEVCSNEELELRSLLDDKIAFQHLMMFAKKRDRHGLLVCWQACEQYRKLETDDIERLFTLANACCSAGFQENAAVRFVAYRARIEHLFLANNAKKAAELPKLFLCIQRCCFESIVLEIYLAFQNSKVEYAAMCTALRTAYNMVKLSDFDYISKLGSGKYGVVVHCRKISTGVHYAMSKYNFIVNA